MNGGRGEGVGAVLVDGLVYTLKSGDAGNDGDAVVSEVGSKASAAAAILWSCEALYCGRVFMVLVSGG